MLISAIVTNSSHISVANSNNSLCLVPVTCLTCVRKGTLVVIAPQRPRLMKAPSVHRSIGKSHVASCMQILQLGR